MIEYELEKSKELLGRLEEQVTQTRFLDQRLAEAEERLEDFLDKFESEALELAVDETMNLNSRLSEAHQTNSWILALGEAGIPNDIRLKIWDLKIAMDEEQKELAENS